MGDSNTRKFKSPRKGKLTEEIVQVLDGFGRSAERRGEREVFDGVNDVEDVGLSAAEMGGVGGGRGGERLEEEGGDAS